MYTIEEHTSLARSHTVKPPQPPGGRRGGAVGAGAVTAVQFSADGYCVAVGWKRGGVGTWSVFGARLMSLADLDGDSAMAGHESDGVTSLSWGPEGYALSTTLAKRSVVVQVRPTFDKSLDSTTRLVRCADARVTLCALPHHSINL
jgi:WD40 repeat protein